MAAAIGCSSAFLTPIAHPVNLIMVGPGNYRFGDFFKAGAGLMLVTLVALMAGIVIFWRLSGANHEDIDTEVEHWSPRRSPRRQTS